MQHIKIFDSLRGLMALWVVFAHTFMTYDIFLPSYLNKVFNVAYAVDVFIILSGFVIFLLLDKKNESYGYFITRRFFRIFPVYWFLLFISALTLSTQHELWRNIGSSGHYWTGRLSTIQSTIENFDFHLLFHVPLLQGLVNESFLKASDFAFIEPAWSLSLEWQFYIIAPLLFLGIKIFPINTKKSIFILIISAIIISAFYGRGGVGYLPKEMHSFIVGMSSYFLWKFIQTNKLGILILIVCLASSIVIRSVPLFVWFVFFALAVGNSPQVRLLKRFFESYWFELLGKISYPLYLVHTLVVYIPLYFVQKEYINLTVTEQIWLTIALSLIFSFVIHHIVEKPGMNIGRKWLKKKSDLAKSKDTI
jgi:peptidoglycan/LPS O-acetylase OafA/YrhL